MPRYPTGAASLVSGLMAGKAEGKKRENEEELKKLLIQRTKNELELAQKKGSLIDQYLGGGTSGEMTPVSSIRDRNIVNQGMNEPVAGELPTIPLIQRMGAVRAGLPSSPEEIYRYNAVAKIAGLPEYQPRDYASTWRNFGEGMQFELDASGQPTGRTIQTPMTVKVATPSGGERMEYGLPSTLFGGGGVQTKPERADTYVPTTELINYVDGDGDHPPAGTTYGMLEDAVKSGEYKAMSVTQQGQLLSLRGASRMVETLERLGDEIFNSDGIGRIWETIRNPIAGSLQIGDIGKKIALYRKYQQGFIASLVRTFGEKGNLNEGDIQRAINLLPRIYPVPDSKEVYRANIAELKAFIAELDMRPEKNLTPEEAQKNVDELTQRAHSIMRSEGIFDATGDAKVDEDTMREVVDLGWQGPGNYEIDGITHYFDHPKQFLRAAR